MGESHLVRTSRALGAKRDRLCWSLLALAVLITSVACSAHAQSPAADASGSADSAPTTVPADVQHVCTRFVHAALSVDATTDQGPADARMRAAREFGVPELVGHLQGQGRDPDWPMVVAHRAHVQVATQPVGDDPPPARGDSAGAGVHATRVAVGADGWRQPMPELVAYCSLRRGPGGWKVTDLTLSDSDLSGVGR